MTAGLDSMQSEAVAERSPRVQPSVRRRVLRVAPVIGVPVGALFVMVAYHHAAVIPEPDDMQFALYWIGFFAGMVPLICLACSRAVTGFTRACALAGIGLYGMTPRLMRSGPAGSDEFVHFRQATEALLSGDVGHPLKMLPITQEFFGLHQVASAVARLTGLSLWYSGITVIALAHVLSVLAIYQLIRVVGIPAAGAAVGAVVYTVNPSWLFFHAGFSYESLGTPLVLWCIVAAVAAGRPTSEVPARAIGASLLCVAVLPMVHHLSTMLLVVILALLIVVRVVCRFVQKRRRAVDLAVHRERIWPLVLILIALLGSIQIWWSDKYDWLLSYLSPAWTEGFGQLGKILNRSGATSAESSGKRKLFADSLNPAYEIASGLLYPCVVLVVFLVAMSVLWRYRCRVSSAVWAFAVLGALFFASMPMLLTQGGSEGAHRSWAYSFIGVSVMSGLAWSFRRRDSGPLARWIPVADRTLRHQGVQVTLALLAYVVLAVGATTLGVNVSTRFPGAAHVGDDARSVSNESAAVADWMAANAPVDTPVLADRYATLQIGGLGRMSALRPSARFPLWDLYMSPEPLRPEVLKMLSDSKIRYLVVDARMSTERPRMGYWFTRNEPGVRGDVPFPQSAIERFDCLPWLDAVYGVGPLTVYEVNRELLHQTAAGSCPEPKP